MSRRSMCVVLPLAAAACSDDLTGPEREITLNFCAEWVAYQNEGEAWTSLSRTSGPVSFVATERVGIATVSLIGPQGTPSLEIRYLTAEQAESTFTCGAATIAPTTRELRGSVAGVGPDTAAFISTGLGGAIADAAFPSFFVQALRNDPFDLVAVRRVLVSSTPPSGRSDRIIIRRDENQPDGSTMPVLDFSSSDEAFAPEPNTLTVTGLAAGATMSVSTSIVTGGGAGVPLSFAIDQGNPTVTILSIPESRLVDGDLHETRVESGTRSLVLFHREPADRTIALGPLANTPVFARGGVGESLRIEVASQPEYGSRISVSLVTSVPATQVNAISVTATKEFFGRTPATWVLPVPDFRGVPGFSPTWGFQPGGNHWSLLVTSFPYGSTAAAARDGDIFRTATGSGVAVLDR